jgi:CheY-like chemotaxis protein
MGCPSAGGEPVPKDILLVDDEVTICEALKAFLADYGHRVTYATNGEAAVKEVLHADLAICDLKLGHENGLRVIERLKAARPELKVLVLTAYPTIEDLQTATELGVAGFLTKPLGMPELLSTVDRVFGEGLGNFLLFPSSLKQTLEGIVPYLGEVTTAEGPNWLRVRAQVRTTAPAGVLVDAAAPDALDFLDACKRELEGRAVFMLCREEDFNTARQLLGRLQGVKCLTLGSNGSALLRSIREQLLARREESERVRAMLARQLARCEYAAPLHIGYYCTIAGPCPFGEDKDAVVTVKGRDHRRCPRRPFPIPVAEKVGLLTWSGVPEEATIIDYRARAMEVVRQGKTHIVVNAQTLEAAHFNLVEILADIEAGLADKPDARVDVINLSPRLLAALRKAGQFHVDVQFHGRVLLELETQRA